MTDAGERTFFVETYVPQLDEVKAAELSTRLRTVVGELEGLRWVRSFALVDEETFIWIVAAADVDVVEHLIARAAVEYDHVTEALPLEPGRG